MKATTKNPSIDRVLTELTGKNRIEMITEHACVMCPELVKGFNDPLSFKEYQISGMCQTCQDSVFGPPQDD